MKGYLLYPDARQPGSPSEGHSGRTQGRMGMRSDEALGQEKDSRGSLHSGRGPLEPVPLPAVSGN